MMMTDLFTYCMCGVVLTELVVFKIRIFVPSLQDHTGCGHVF